MEESISSGTIRVAMIANSGASCRNSQKHFILEMICDIAQASNINVHLVYPRNKNESYGDCVNNTCTGVMELLRTDEADLSADLMLPIRSRLPYVFYTNYLIEDRFYFVRAPELNGRLTGDSEAYFKVPFGQMFIIAMVLIFLLLWFVRIAEGSMAANGDRAWLAKGWQLFSVTVGHNHTNILTVLCTVTIMNLMYYGGYRGQVLFALKQKPIFQDIEGLIKLLKSKKVQLALNYEDNIAIRFIESYPEFVHLTSLPQYKPIYLPNYAKNGGMDLCKNPRLVGFVNLKLETDPYCDLQLVAGETDLDPNHYLVMMFAKKPSMLRSHFLDRIQLLNEILLMTKAFKRRSFHSLNPNKIKFHEQFSKPIPVRFQSLKVVFICMVGLFLTSLFVLALEIVVQRYC